MVVAAPEHAEQRAGLAVEVDRVILDAGRLQQGDQLGPDRVVAAAIFVLPTGVGASCERRISASGTGSGTGGVWRESHFLGRLASAPAPTLPLAAVRHGGLSGAETSSRRMATVLATGGAGYIGSHIVGGADGGGPRRRRFSTTSRMPSEDAPARIAAIGHGMPAVVAGDIRDPASLDAAFAGRGIDAVIHLAGLKAVGESVAQPLRYFDVNVGGAVALFEAMRRHGVRRLVFSSSATVYGAPETNPIARDRAAGGAQPLRAHQADDRADHRRPRGRRGPRSRRCRCATSIRSARILRG